MQAKDYLLREINRLGETAKAVARAAEDENRDMTEAERGQVETAITRIGEIKAEVQGMEDRARMKQLIEDSILTGGKPSSAPVEPKSLGEAFVKSGAYQALKERGVTGRWSTGPIEFGQKLTDAGLSVVATSDAGGNLPLQPQVTPIVSPTENPLVIAALFGQGVATQNTIVYLEETTTTPGALSERYSDSDATVSLTAEGAEKPAAFINFTKRSTSLDKIAAFLPVSDEMIEDEPQIASYINGRLAIFIRQAEDAYLLDELLAAPLNSVVDASSIGTDGNWFDAIAAGVLEVQRKGGLNPDAVLMNPFDYWSMSVSKSAGDGNYFGGSPYSAAQRNPWGIPVVVSNGVNSGTAIVGAFREGATVWRKGGLTVEASNSHSDYFRKNLTAIRAEERVALTVYRPGAFQKVQK